MLENVPAVANAPVLERHLEILANMKYSVASRTISYADYGAATRRRRYFAIGFRNRVVPFFKLLSDYSKPPRTVRDAIWKLREREKGSLPDHEWFDFRTIHKYRKYYRTGKYGWYALDWDQPAPSFGNVAKTYILHPDAANGQSRVISIREALSIMGFNSHFQFPKGISLRNRYQMVADTVSPVVSIAMAKVFREIIQNWDGKGA